MCQSGEAWLLFKEGDKTKALNRMNEAVALEDKTGKHSVTPGEVLPAREMLADLLMEMQKPAEALASYEINLQQRPRKLNSVFHAGQAAEKTGDMLKAKTYYEQVLQLTGDSSQRQKEHDYCKRFLAKRN
jgi:tetratricopeptide (TPR) repeat protein